MSFNLHPTKNKNLKPGEPKYYQIIEGRGKDRVTHVLQFANDHAAALYDNELKRSHKHTPILAAVVETFNKMLPDFLHYYQHELERRPRSIDAWLQGWNNLKPFFGHLKPTQLTPKLIEQYKAERLTHKAGTRYNTVCKRTIQKELHNLSSFVKYAVDNNLCEPLPFKIKGYLKKNTQAAPVIPPTPEQVQEMFRQVKRTECLDLYKTFYYTGLRSEEMRALQRKHIYLEWDIMTVFGKGGKWRIVPIVAAYRDSIVRLCNGIKGPRKPRNKKERESAAEDGLYYERGEELGPDDYLLISKRTGKPYSANVGRLDTAAKKAGIQTHITPHVLRKCFSTHCIHWGCDMRTLQLILGHAEITTTEKYTFLPPSMLSEKLLQFGIDKTQDLNRSGLGQSTNNLPDNYKINQLVAK